MYCLCFTSTYGHIAVECKAWIKCERFCRGVSMDQWINALHVPMELYYISDIPEQLRSTVRLFADNILAYLTIKSDRDQELFQQDLDKLAEWEKTWKMDFHPQKCQVMHITRKHQLKLYNYTLHRHVLFFSFFFFMGWKWHTDLLTVGLIQGPLYSYRIVSCHRSLVGPSPRYSPSHLLPVNILC